MHTSHFKSFFALAVLFTGLCYQSIAGNERNAISMMQNIQPHDWVTPVKHPKTQLSTFGKENKTGFTSASATIMQGSQLVADVPFESTESLVALVRRSPKFKRGTLTAAIQIKGQTIQSFKIIKK